MAIKTHRTADQLALSAPGLLRLYTAGQTGKSLVAISNLHRMSEQYFAGQYLIEVVDVLENPQLAEDDNIVAIPTLIRKRPEPIRRIIGDLSDTEKALSVLLLMERKEG
ncbi:MAG TPA: circadian clock protein KaiB [Rhodospirillaceae bacterium]|nr:circadian clock protein KaiB [Rhodospirillaceae bacterium]